MVANQHVNRYLFYYYQFFQRRITQKVRLPVRGGPLVNKYNTLRSIDNDLFVITFRLFMHISSSNLPIMLVLCLMFSCIDTLYLGIYNWPKPRLGTRGYIHVDYISFVLHFTNRGCQDGCKDVIRTQVYRFTYFYLRLVSVSGSCQRV